MSRAAAGAALTLLVVLLSALTMSQSAQAGVTTLYVFQGGTDGNQPQGKLVEGADHNFYGTTYLGGTYGHGTVFKIGPNGGTPAYLYSFCSQTDCTDGSGPAAGLILASDGSFYGTTEGGGASNLGTVFQLALVAGTWKETVIYSFGGSTDGSYPQAPLIQGSDGNLYGTTFDGGENGGGDSFGTLFGITTSGTLTYLYNFCPFSETGCTDGGNPVAGLIPGSGPDINFYGTNFDGAGSSAYGTVFHIDITSRSTPTTIYSFYGTASRYPSGSLVLGTDGNLYGTTQDGGGELSGAVFGVTLSGTPTILYFFSGPTGGRKPVGGLVQATNGNFYGTTFNGGTDSAGTIFEITAGGTQGQLFRFDSASNGANPSAGLVQGSNGALYGATQAGGSYSAGTVFKLTQDPTSTSLISSLHPSIFGQSVSFTATVTSESGIPGAEVTFKNGNANLGTVTPVDGVATFATTSLAAGTHEITAVFDGGPNFSGSTSSVLSQVVSPATTTVTLTSSLNPSTFGQSVKFTATVNPQFSGTPGAPVTFKDGSATLGAVTPVGGVATLTTTSLAVGTHSITAAFGGGPNFSASTSSVLSQAVNSTSP